MVAKIGPVAEYPKLEHLRSAVDMHILHRVGVGRKLLFAEGLTAGREEKDVVGHQVQHGRGITVLARPHPSLNKIANSAFVVRHVASPVTLSQ